MVVPSITAKIRVIQRMLPDWVECLDKRICIVFLFLQVAENDLSRDHTLRVNLKGVGSGTAPGHIDQFRPRAIGGDYKISVRVWRPHITCEAPLGAAGEKGATGLAGFLPRNQTGG